MKERLSAQQALWTKDPDWLPPGCALPAPRVAARRGAGRGAQGRESGKRRGAPLLRRRRMGILLPPDCELRSTLGRFV